MVHFYATLYRFIPLISHKKILSLSLLANNLGFFALYPLIDQGRSFFSTMWEIRNFSSRDQYNCCWWWRVLAYVEFSLLAEPEQRRRPRIPPAQPHSSRRCTTFVSPKFVVNCETFLLLQKFLNMGVNQSKGSVDITSTPNKGPAPEVNGKKADEKIIDEKTKVRFLVFFCTGCPKKFVNFLNSQWFHTSFSREKIAKNILSK